MADDPRLPRAIAFSTLASVTATPRGEKASAITENRAAPRLVEGDPIFYLRTEGFETHPGVVFVILHELVLVQHTPISLVQVVGEIPVKQRYHRFDGCGAEVVDQLDVVLQTLLVHRVVASAEGDDTGPREGKAVGFCADFFQKSNILVSAVVGIAGHIARLATSNLAWDAAEGVPDGVGAAILMRRAFDLVAVGSKLSMWQQYSPQNYMVAG